MSESPSPESTRPAGRDGTTSATEAFRQLQIEVARLRETVAALSNAAPRSGETPADADRDIDALRQSIQSLEGYMTIGFFDRVRTTIAEAATAFSPDALDRRVRRLRRLVWVLVLLQALTLALVAWTNQPALQPLLDSATALFGTTPAEETVNPGG